MLAFDTLNVDDKIKSELMQFEIDFAFQPIFSREGDIVAYEALMRPEGRNVLDYIEEMRRKNKLRSSVPLWHIVSGNMTKSYALILSHRSVLLWRKPRHIPNASNRLRTSW